ncbi:hypothetical protein D3C85_1433020 [compost metagenome]
MVKVSLRPLAGPACNMASPSLPARVASWPAAANLARFSSCGRWLASLAQSSKRAPTGNSPACSGVLGVASTQPVWMAGVRASQTPSPR